MTMNEDLAVGSEIRYTELHGLHSIFHAVYFYEASKLVQWVTRATLQSPFYKICREFNIWIIR